MGSPAKNKIEIDYRANKIASEKLRQLGISPNLMNVPCGAKTKISPDRRTVWVTVAISVPMEEVQNFIEAD